MKYTELLPNAEIISPKYDDWDGCVTKRWVLSSVRLVYKIHGMLYFLEAVVEQILENTNKKKATRKIIQKFRVSERKQKETKQTIK